MTEQEIKTLQIENIQLKIKLIEVQSQLMNTEYISLKEKLATLEGQENKTN